MTTELSNVYFGLAIALVGFPALTVAGIAAYELLHARRANGSQSLAVYELALEKGANPPSSRRIERLERYYHDPRYPERGQELEFYKQVFSVSEKLNLPPLKSLPY